MSYCRVCGGECTGKLLVEARKGVYYSVCQFCLGLGLEEIKKRIYKSHD